MIRVLLVAFAFASLWGGRVDAQTITFRNAMQSAADVIITAVGSTVPSRFAIGANNLVDFDFGQGTLFNIQVIPRDAPDTGFRFESVDLSRLTGIVQLDGKFGPDKSRLICYRYGLFRRRCCCCIQKVRGERIAVDLTSTLKGGGAFNMLREKMTYDEVMAPWK